MSSGLGCKAVGGGDSMELKLVITGGVCAGISTSKNLPILRHIKSKICTVRCISPSKVDDEGSSLVQAKHQWCLCQFFKHR